MGLRALSAPERILWKAFRVGARVDLTNRRDRVIRGSVIRALLLGGSPSAPGYLPALRLTGADITGKVGLAYANVTAPISLQDCRIDEPMDLYGVQLRQLSLNGCVLPGFIACNASIDASIRLAWCTSTAEINLVGAHIGGALILDGSTIMGANQALNGTRLRVGSDFRAQNGFRCTGELRLDGAEVGGSLRWEGATLTNPDGDAVFAPGLRVAAIANLCDGFTANGGVRLSNAQIGEILCLQGATLNGAGKRSLHGRHLVTRVLALLPVGPPAAMVDLSHARIGLLRDDPATWPPAMGLEGLTYEALSDQSNRIDRLRWLRLDPDGFRSQAYTQLASIYRGSGHDDDARTVQLAGERHRRERLSLVGRLWGRLQDITVGYGYRPFRALGWLAALITLGAVVFHLVPPRAAEPAKAPDFVSPVFAADLILPGIDFGQQSAFHPRGATAWLAYFLIIAGLLFVTTIAAATARRLRRT